MAGIDVGGAAGGRRATNSDINMIPFIDLLMVTIAFLLITAVWTTESRINANTEVPGPPGCGLDCPPQLEKVLHVQVSDCDFGLVWKQAGTVVSEVHVPRDAGDGSAAAKRYPELAQAVQKGWAANGSHVDPSDRKPDLAVLHSEDRLPFKEIVAVLDALNATKREMRLADGTTARVAAFNTTFSVR